MKNSYLYLFVVLCMLFAFEGVQAQKLENASTKITISGTSTIHEWDVMATEGKFVGEIVGNSIQNVKFMISTYSIVSGKSTMDKNMYKALKADKYPYIVFEADKISNLLGNNEVKGKLTIIGNEKTVLLPISIAKEEGGYVMQGFTQINMKDFGVEPPLFMMGAVKTGDVISIKFTVSIKVVE